MQYATNKSFKKGKKITIKSIKYQIIRRFIQSGQPQGIRKQSRIIIDCFEILMFNSKGEG